MAGIGPAPKEPSRRARNNKDPHPTVRLPFQHVDPPELPKGYEWHPATRAWWRDWQESPMSQLMGATDWAFLKDTALLHNALWGNSERGMNLGAVAAELRIRSAKFGATPEDRLRLRIQWADADARDSEVPQTAPVPARDKYAQLRVLPTRTDGAS